jgi:hypothetical protein
MDRSTGSSEEEDAALTDSYSNDDSDLYEVEKIVNRRVKPDTSLKQYFEYFVQWKGYEDRTWEPAAHMQSVPKKIKEYEKLGLADVEYVVQLSEQKDDEESRHSSRGANAQRIEDEEEEEAEEEEEEEEELWHLESHYGDWTYQPLAVTTWLDLYGLLEYTQRFADVGHGDLHVLLDIELDDKVQLLKEIGLGFSDIIRFNRAIKMWTSGEKWSFRSRYLTAWLKNIGLPEYAHKFAQEDYHYLEDLLDMTMEEKDDIIVETGMLLEKKLTFNAMLKRLAVGEIRGGYLAGRELHHYPNGRNPIGRPLQVGDIVIIVQLSAWVLTELWDIEDDETVKCLLTRGVLTKAVTETILQVQVSNLYERFEVVNNEVGNNEHWWYEKDVLEKRVRLAENWFGNNI